MEKNVKKYIQKQFGEIRRFEMTVRRNEVIKNEIENIQVYIDDRLILEAIEMKIDASILDAFSDIKKIDKKIQIVLCNEYVNLNEEFINELISKYRDAGWTVIMDWFRLILILF